MTAKVETSASGAAKRRRDAVLERMNGTWRTVEQEHDPARSGPQERMRVLYQIHADALVRAFLHWTQGDRQAAEDLMQETMLRAWRNLDKFHVDPVSLRPWLITVGRRLAIDALRARAARPPETTDEVLEWLALPEPYDQVLDRSVIHDMLSELPEQHRQVLVHVYVHDLTVPETARLLGVPEGTVKSRLHSARRAVRAEFAPRLADQAA